MDMFDEVAIAIRTFHKRRNAGETRIIDLEAHAIRLVTDWANMIFVSDIDESLTDYRTWLGPGVTNSSTRATCSTTPWNVRAGRSESASRPAPSFSVGETYAIHGEPVKFTPQCRPMPWEANANGRSNS
jgi:hypothetical protein